MIHKIMYFYADWSTHSDTQDTYLESIQPHLSHQNISLEKLNIEQNQTLALTYNVESLPTLIFLDNCENIVHKCEGVCNPEQIRGYIDLHQQKIHI